jgi:hypothetical protein
VGDYTPAGFVAQNRGTLDDILAKSSMVVVVKIGSANADRGDLDQDFAPSGRRHRAIHHSHIEWAVEHGRPLTVNYHWPNRRSGAPDISAFKLEASAEFCETVEIAFCQRRLFPRKSGAVLAPGSFTI